MNVASRSLLPVFRAATRLSFSPSLLPPIRHYSLEESVNIRNEKIPFDMVRLVDEETKKPGDPIPLKDVLEMRKHPSKKKAHLWETTHYVEMVRPPSRDMGGYALVKLFEREAMAARARGQRERQRETRKLVEKKEVQLTWHIARGDMEHKLRKVRDEISRGYRVDLVFAPKTGQQPLSREQMDAKATEAVEALQDVAREWKLRDNRRKNLYVVFLQDRDRALPQKSSLAMRGSQAEFERGGNNSFAPKS